MSSLLKALNVHNDDDEDDDAGRPALCMYIVRPPVGPSAARDLFFLPSFALALALPPSVLPSLTASAAARSLDRRSFAIPAAEIALLSGEGGAAAVAAIKLDSTRGASRSGNAGF